MHDLALATFHQPRDNDKKLTGITSRIADAAAHVSKRETDKAVIEVEQARKAWAGKIPDRPFDLWPWVQAQEQASLLSLLAHLVAGSIDAIRYRHEKHLPSRLIASRRLARAVDLDMANHWTADADFLARLPKSMILGIVAEALSPEDARGIDRGGKADLVAAAARKLAGTDWLPPVLRTPVDNNDEHAPDRFIEEEISREPSSKDATDEIEPGDG